MNTPTSNVDQQQRRCILNHLKDMFGGTFDEDIIESVLCQRDWNVDRAIDDLMAMSCGNTFEIPVEDVGIQMRDLASNERFHTSENSAGHNDKNVDCEDDGIVVLDEEEYVLPTESDESESATDENYRPPQRPFVAAPSSFHTASYASMAQRPASEKASLAAAEQTVRAKPPYLIHQGYTSYDRIKRTRDSVERVKLYVQNSFKIMVILRGCPGSGKSTLGKHILKECNITNNPLMHIHSSDSFHVLNGRGKYKCELSLIPNSHSWNAANVLNVVREGLTPIIVDNTNTEIWEMKNYASIAVCAGYEIEVIEPDTPWAFNINQLFSRNVHNVPKEALARALDRYEHHVSATTLLKHFNLKYSPELVPPKTGVRTISKPEIVSTFDHIYRIVYQVRETASEPVADAEPLTKAQKKKERRKLRQMIEEEAAAAAAFVELDDLTETDSANSMNEAETDNVTADEEEGSVGESESDPSWLTVDEEDDDDEDEDEDDDDNNNNDESTEGSTANEDELVEETKELTADSDAQSGPTEKKENETEETDDKADDGVHELLCEEITNVVLNSEVVIPLIVDDFGIPLKTVDADESTDVEVSGSRLKCFEQLRDGGLKEGLESSTDQVLNNALSTISDGEVKEDPTVPTKSMNLVLNNIQASNANVNEVGPDNCQISAASLSTSTSVSKSADDLSSSELVVSKSSDDNASFVTSTSSPLEHYVDSSAKPADSPDPNVSPSKKDRASVKVVDNVFNTNTKDLKLKLCNVEGQKNTPVDAVSDTACSHKPKDDSSGNVIANDLWSAAGKSEIDVESSTPAGEEKELSSDNSDNLESRSNSSSSDEMAMTDVHNTSNRFVNNDIQNQQSERKKPNINHQKNRNVADDVVDNVWNVAESIVPELNTLKERILINSLDKVFNQNQNLDFPTDSTGAVPTPVALPQRRPAATSSFHIIENKLKDECREQCSPSSSRSEEFEDAIDTSESKLLNQWIRGESWDESTKDVVQQTKKNECEVKPQRTVRDSPSKQKNREAASNIRLVNDIRNVSDNSKMCLLLDKKNKNQDAASQPLKSTNFQSQFLLDRSSPRSLNTLQRVSSKEEDIESDFEAKSKSFRASEDCPSEAQRINVFNRSYPSLFKHFEPSDPQAWPDSAEDSRSTWQNTEEERRTFDKGSPELLDSLIASHQNDNSSDFEKSFLKWSPFSEPAKNKVDETLSAAAADNSYFVPVEIMNQERNKATNTGLDECAAAPVIKIGRCREINQGRASPERSVIESSYKCDKSTMMDRSSYTVKAKPLKEDLVNIFPLDLVDLILDLYDKCSGNMDWIIEILMEGGHSPSDDQLEYLSSLQNVKECEVLEENSTIEKREKVKRVPDKKKNKGKNSKNGRGGGHLQLADGRKKVEACASAAEFNEPSPSEGTDSAPEEHVDLFFDWCTVSQLVNYFGNPTVYTIGDYQPTVTLPISLARQLHAYLIGSIIDQAEENEDLVNQLSDEDHSINSYIESSNVEELSQKDLTEVENSLSDFLQDPLVNLSGKGGGEGAEGGSVKIVRNQDSFASKLSLNLLLKAFPTLDSSFVKSTFKSQNFNYYDTKNVLNQFGREVPIDAPRDSPLNEHDSIENYDDIQYLGTNTDVADTGDVLKRVTECRENASLNRSQWQKCHDSLRTAVQEKKFGVAAYYRDVMNAFRQKYEQCNAHAAAVLINSCCLQNSDMIDLHFFNVTEAVKALDKFVDEHLRRLMLSGRSRMTLYIITGRGARSKNGISRIQPSVKSKLKRRNITFEIESYNPGLVKAIIRRNSLLSTDL